MIAFKQFTLEDKVCIDPYLAKVTSRSCRFSFANMLLWSEYFGTKFAIVEDSLVMESRGQAVTFPIGAEDPEPALQEIFKHFEEKGMPCKMIVSAEDGEYLESHYPEQFKIIYPRDDAEYVYETEKLIHLTGKKYQAKRNHINKFKNTHDEWCYEPITDENRDECLAMLEEWAAQNRVEESVSKTAEVKVAQKFLTYMEPLELDGGLIRAEGRVVAFTIGEPLREDTYCVHIEKAFADIDGAYPLINQKFAENAASAYQYINREEDTGVEGLRKAKLSYHPVMFVETGMAEKIEKETITE